MKRAIDGSGDVVTVGGQVDREQGQKRRAFDMLAEGAFRQVAAVLRQAGVPCAPVKGLVLSRWLYRDVSERPYVDVDLLVPRGAFARAALVVEQEGWPVFYRSSEMGELSFMVGRVPVEFHAEFGRADLSRVSVDDVLARARPDNETFGFEISRIDDTDHFLLLILNVVKDGITYANRHQPDDLNRLLTDLTASWETVVSRAAWGGMLTALEITATWMVDEHRSATFGRFQQVFPRRRRRLFVTIVGAHRRLTSRRPHRLKDAGSLLGLALATLTPDDVSLRLNGLTRIIRRGAGRGLRRDPG